LDLHHRCQAIDAGHVATGRSIVFVQYRISRGIQWAMGQWKGQILVVTTITLDQVADTEEVDIAAAGHLTVAGADGVHETATTIVTTRAIGVTMIMIGVDPEVTVEEEIEEIVDVTGRVRIGLAIGLGKDRGIDLAIDLAIGLAIGPAIGPGIGLAIGLVIGPGIGHEIDHEIATGTEAGEVGSTEVGDRHATAEAGVEARAILGRNEIPMTTMATMQTLMTIGEAAALMVPNRMQVKLAEHRSHESVVAAAEAVEEAERVEKRSDILEAEAVLQRLVALLGSSCGKSILKSCCVVRAAACLAVK